MCERVENANTNSQVLVHVKVYMVYSDTNFRDEENRRRKRFIWGSGLTLEDINLNVWEISQGDVRGSNLMHAYNSEENSVLEIEM